MKEEKKRPHLKYSELFDLSVSMTTFNVIKFYFILLQPMLGDN